MAIFVLAICLAFYFLPTFIALSRSHPQAIPILLLNIFLGWTLVGWVIALVWCATNNQPVVVVRDNRPWS